MLKKNIFIFITCPILFLTILTCIFFYISASNWIEQKNEKRYKEILNTFTAKIESVKNIDELNTIPDLKNNNFTKNSDILYLMVLDNNGKVLFDNKKKFTGKTYNNDTISYEEIIKYKKTFQRKIKFLQEEFIEIGQSVNLKEMTGIAILGISLKQLNFYKIVLWLILISFLAIMLVAGNLLSKIINKELTAIFSNLEFSCSKILSLENISERDFTSISETKTISSVLIKISQLIQNFRIELDKLRVDSLTGLCNSKYIKERLQYELLKAHRYNRPLSCIVVEIFNLDYIAQHVEGKKIDIILKDIADIYRNDLRKVDLIGKLGASSFLILLPEIQESQSYIVAERLLNKLKQYKIKENKIEFSLDVIMGINSYIHKKTGTDENTFIAQIEELLHYAKLDGNSKIVFCSKAD